MVLHRGRGPGGRVAALAPVGHLPVHAANSAGVFNPHLAGTRPTTRGLAAYNGRAPDRLSCRALWRRVHRAPRESSWLLPDGQQGRPTEGRDFFSDRSRVSLPRETLGACTRGTVLRGWSRPWSRRIARQGTSRMSGTLIPSASAVLSARLESLSWVGNPAAGNGPENNRLRQQNQPTPPRTGRLSRTGALEFKLPCETRHREALANGRRRVESKRMRRFVWGDMVCRFCAVDG